MQIGILKEYQGSPLRAPGEHWSLHSMIFMSTLYLLLMMILLVLNGNMDLERMVDGTLKEHVLGLDSLFHPVATLPLYLENLCSAH